MTAEARRIIDDFREKHPTFKKELRELDSGVPLYFDKDGSPLTRFEWATLFEEFDYRVVGRTEIPPFGFVSTVWLGLNHAYYGGPPLLFETMIFLKEITSDVQRRYATLEEAIRGHAYFVERAKDNILNVVEPPLSDL